MAARAFTAVLTKPEGQSAALAAQLAAAGIDVFDFPLIDIAPVADPAPLDAAFARLHAYALVVFVSPNAIDRALARYNAIWPHSLPIGVVGPGSVAALARHGIAAPAHRVIAPEAGPDGEGADGGGDAAPRYDSESLFAQIERAFAAHGGASGASAAAAIASDSLESAGQSSDETAASAASGPLAGKRVLIVRGDGGREWLSTALRDAGAEVDGVAERKRVV
uniref:uroporphyrinogen-III synthase n=1 Tax=Burkholderia sp. Ac-20379 TaxID=2703900 RepID=UPI001F11B2AB